MKCPKCGYLGFDTGPRCRNCSYDFALLESEGEGTLPLDADRGFSMAEPTAEQSADTWLQAIDLGIAAEDAAGSVTTPVVDRPAEESVATRPVFAAGDLDRLLTRAESTQVSGSAARGRVAPDLPEVDLVEAPRPGTAVPPVETPALETPPWDALGWDGAPDVPIDVASPVPDPFAWPANPARFTGEDTTRTRERDMSAFGDTDPAPPQAPVQAPPLPALSALDPDTPLVQLQRPRAPIAVRKTPMSPKLRAVTQPRPMEPELDFQDEPRSGKWPGTGDTAERTALPPADDSPASRRLGALVVDALLFGGIDLAVVYLTLRIVGLQRHELQVLPMWPLVGFLGLMKVVYVAVFTAMGGQTIGKMAMHIRVVSADNRALSGGAALRRTLASLVSVVTAGLGYLPGLIGRDRRALHDRLTGSRVVTVGAS